MPIYSWLVCVLSGVAAFKRYRNSVMYSQHGKEPLVALRVYTSRLLLSLQREAHREENR